MQSIVLIPLPEEASQNRTVVIIRSAVLADAVLEGLEWWSAVPSFSS